MIFKLFLPSSMRDRAAAKMRRGLSYREIQSFNKRRVEGAHRILPMILGSGKIGCGGCTWQRAEKLGCLGFMR